MRVVESNKNTEDVIYSEQQKISSLEILCVHNAKNCSDISN